MHCIVITCIWTKSQWIYSVVYKDEESAKKAIRGLPYSSDNNSFEVKQLN